MQELTRWLDELGLGAYSQRFVEADIDVSVLRYLTDQDLKELGVSLGHRRRILTAIAELAATAAVPAQTSSGNELGPQDSAERRQVTVMFCDLVDSTALSASMDPEDLSEIFAAYQECIAESVHRFDGYVAKYMGDGVLVYFGYPQAHEHDAERAARVGLDIIANVGKLRTPASAPLEVRIGIATGMVVVGDLIGSGQAQERGIVGETPNLAARLQALAEPNMIVTSESTRRLIGDLFEYRDLGIFELKGLRQPVRALQIVAESTVESRFEALHSSALTALIGREEEADLLQQRWRRAKEGDGQVVLISGEPGIGKSRLTAAIIEQIGAEPHARVRYLCSPHHMDSALHPIIQRLERAAGFTPHDNAQAKLDKLDALMELTSTPTEDRAIIAGLLSLPAGTRYPAIDLSPQERRIRTIDAMIRRLEVMAHQKPVLAIFEDVQWIDPTSRAVLGRMIERICNLPVLLLVTFRPEFQQTWAGEPHVSVLALTRLASWATADLVARILGNKALPDDVVEEIVARTDGVPLFVEELTKAAIEGGTGEGARETVANTPSSSQAIPATLHASLMARLDRLGAAKDVARIGAAIGREFSYELLAAVSGSAENELTKSLDRLVDAGLLFRDGMPPRATFLFKHALVRDAAYGMLLRRDRRELHARIGLKLEEVFPDFADKQPALLAYHFEEGGMPEMAVEYWLKAGRQAVSRATMTEALSHLNKGFALLSLMPEDARRRQDELALQLALASALMATLGPAAPAVGEAYGRARELWEMLGQPSRFEPRLPLFWHHLARGEIETADRMASELVEIGTARRDVAVEFLGTVYLAESCLDRGDFVSARLHSERSISIYDPALVSPRLLFNGRVYALVVLSRTLFCLGCIDQARSTMQQALGEARQLSNPFTIAMTLWGSLFGEFETDLASTLLDRAEEAVALKFAFFSQPAAIVRNWCLFGSEPNEQHMAELAETLGAYRDSGSMLSVPFFLMLLADALERTGHRAAASERLTEALGLVETTQERWIEAELHRRSGELLKSAGNIDAAEAAFDTALAVARRQSAKIWELRAAVSIARVWTDRGSRQKARDLLSPIYGRFSEGFDTPDLKEAKALLDELSGGPTVKAPLAV
jgi:class 3 adenylate cyclase/predicted ATPase